MLQRHWLAVQLLHSSMVTVQLFCVFYIAYMQKSGLLMKRLKLKKLIFKWTVKYF